MRDVFHTDDGDFHQAVLALNRLVLVRLVVERLALKDDFADEWEWMVWPVRGPWDDSEAALQGRESSLEAAKQQAFDAGISMLADMTRYRAAYLPSFAAMKALDAWPEFVPTMR